MAATPYLVMVPTQDSYPARTLVNGVEGMLIVAGSTADAIALAKAQYEQDQNKLWDNATTTALVADTNLHNWVLDIVINKPDGTLKGHVTVAVDGTDAAVAASQVLTSSANFSDTETVTIGTKVYTFQSSLTNTDGHVKIAASEALSLANLHHAINGTGGVAGTDYAAATTAHPDVTAVDNGVHTLTATAKVAGTAGNAIATTETSATAAWGAATLAGGQDSDTFDTVGTAAVAALNAAGVGVTHAAYNASTNVLTVAGTADNLGDHDLIVSFFPADRVRDVGIPGALGSVTDEGSAGAALSVAFAADNWVIPIGAAGLRQVA